MVSDPARRMSERPTIQARHHLVSTGHYLATSAAMRILEAGGNATDAGVAAGICINVLMPDLTSFGGVAPIMVYDRRRHEVRSISGLGPWAREVTIERYVERWKGDIPVGVGRSIIPGAPDAWLTALAEYGTMSFSQVVRPAIELCEYGFPVYASLNRNLASAQRVITQWPATAAIFLPGDRPPDINSVLVQDDLALTLKAMVKAEESASGSRSERIMAARDFFYKGPIGQVIARYVAANGGFMTEQDLADFHVEVEEPVHTTYRGIDVYTCGPWSQGPVVAQTLNILEGYPLAEMQHNSADYLHLISQSLNLAFADREHYYGDPNFVDVPLDNLLSKDYAELQRSRIAFDRAFLEMPPGGLAVDGSRLHPGRGRSSCAPMSQADTSYICVVDRDGNAFSATPSDGCASTPIIPGLGLICSGRGSQSWLDPEHVSRLQGGKRPRLTPNPAIAFHDGRLLMPFGTPGGDVQPQAMVQAFVNMIDFRMEVQEAIEQPRVATYNYPGSFWPHPYQPALLRMEGRISRSIAAELSSLGHHVEYWPNWSRLAGSVCAIMLDHDRGVLKGGADSRAEAYAQGW